MLTHNQDDWAVAFGAFVLAKQAKLELAFRHVQQSIPNASLYLLPSIKGANCIPRRKWLELVDRVKAGATLYMSMGDGIVPGFNDVTGTVLHSRAKAARPMFMSLSDGTKLALPGADDLVLEPTTALAMGRRDDGDGMVYWRNSLGNGQVVVLAAPIEEHLTRTPRAFSAGAMPFWKIYRDIASQVTSRHFDARDPAIAITEHHQTDGTIVVLLINHSHERKVVDGYLPQGMSMTLLRGQSQPGMPHAIEVGPLDCSVIQLTKS